MKDKKYIRTKDYTAEEVAEYNAQILKLENEKARLEESKAYANKSFNAEIKAVENKISKWREEMNDGVYVEAEKYFNKDDMLIEWVYDGQILKTEPMTDEDLDYLERQAQKTLFPDEVTQTTGDLPPDEPPKDKGFQPGWNEHEPIDSVGGPGPESGDTYDEIDQQAKDMEPEQ
jgi:hypothetical protein